MQEVVVRLGMRVGETGRKQHVMHFIHFAHSAVALPLCDRSSALEGSLEKKNKDEGRKGVDRLVYVLSSDHIFFSRWFCLN